MHNFRNPTLNKPVNITIAMHNYEISEILIMSASIWPTVE